MGGGGFIRSALRRVIGSIGWPTTAGRARHPGSPARHLLAGRRRLSFVVIVSAGFAGSVIVVSVPFSAQSSSGLKGRELTTPVTAGARNHAGSGALPDRTGADTATSNVPSSPSGPRRTSLAGRSATALAATATAAPSPRRIPAAAQVQAQLAQTEGRGHGPAPDPAVLALHVPDPIAYKRAKLALDRGTDLKGVAGNNTKYALGGSPAAGAASPYAAVFGSLNEAGLSAKKQIEEHGHFGDLTPPDSTGAIGPANYVEIVNAQIAVYERSSLTLHSGSPLTLSEFTEGTSACDPQVKYDPLSGRWFYAAIRCDNTSSSNELYLGWSKTSDPSSLAGTSVTSGWCKFKITSQPSSSLNDYPKLGLDGTHIVIGTNLFDGTTFPATFQTAQIVVAAKPPEGSTTCTAPAVTFFGSAGSPLLTSIGNEAFTPEPATFAFGADTAGYVVEADKPTHNGVEGNHLMVWEVGGTGAAPTLEAKGDIAVEAFHIPPNVAQEGSTDRIDSLDARLTQAVAGDDPKLAGHPEAVWTQHTTLGSGEGSVVRWYEIVPSKMEVHQHGAIEDPAGFAFNGAIAPTPRGGAVIDYNSGGATQKVKIKAQSRTVTTPLGAMNSEVTLKESSAIDSDYTCPSQPYDEMVLHDEACRWGDYAGASVDPSNCNVVWGSNQVDGPTGAFFSGFGDQAQWATQNFALTTAATPLEQAKECLFVYSNFVKLHPATLEEKHTGIIGWGTIELVSAKAETTISCVDLSFGSAFNTAAGGHGSVLGFSAAGDATNTGAAPRSQCSFRHLGSGNVEAWATAESHLAPPIQGRRQGAGRPEAGEPLSVPWNVELVCGERAEASQVIAEVGVPNTEKEAPRGCETEVAEEETMKREQDAHTGCYVDAARASTPAPEGCIKVLVVVPALGLEERYEGTLRPTAVNGFGNGLNASRWQFEGAPSGSLYLEGNCETSSACVTSTATGETKVAGLGGTELLTAK